MSETIAKPTVSLDVTYAVAYTYGCGDGSIWPTHGAVIDAGPDGRCRSRRACRRPPGAAGSVRSALVAGSEPGAPAAPGGFHHSGTTPPSTTRPGGDASLARSAPGMHPCPPRLCRVCNSLQYTIIKTAINFSPAESLPIIGRDALLALVNWFERQRHHDPSSSIQDMATRAYGTAAAADCPAEPDGDAVPADDTASGGNPQ